VIVIGIADDHVGVRRAIDIFDADGADSGCFSEAGVALVLAVLFLVGLLVAVLVISAPILLVMSLVGGVDVAGASLLRRRLGCWRRPPSSKQAQRATPAGPALSERVALI
jgi:hypothetical protein